MVKFRFMLIAILLVSASANMSAAWRIVFDRNCLKIVMANTNMLPRITASRHCPVRKLENVL
jgi:hypothetical protein